jgi:hypothetical protein
MAHVCSKQSVGDPGTGLVSTKLFQAKDPLDKDLGDTDRGDIDPAASAAWPLLLDLGKSYEGLHQTTLSSDGKYMMAVLSVGPSSDYPNQSIVTIDLIEGKVIHRIVNADQNMPVLAAIPC